MRGGERIERVTMSSHGLLLYSSLRAYEDFSTRYATIPGVLGRVTKYCYGPLRDRERGCGEVGERVTLPSLHCLIYNLIYSQCLNSSAMSEFGLHGS